MKTCTAVISPFLSENENEKNIPKYAIPIIKRANRVVIFVAYFRGKPEVSDDFKEFFMRYPFWFLFFGGKKYSHKPIKRRRTPTVKRSNEKVWFIKQKLIKDRAVKQVSADCCIFG
jgi:hypothetical protein